MHKSIIFSVLFLATHATAIPTAQNPWQMHAKADIASIEKILRDNHPGTLDADSDFFRQWMKTAKNQVSTKLPLVTNECSYQQLLSWYVKGFNDGHLSLALPPTETAQAFEWPGFLMTYDPTCKALRTDPPAHLLTKCPYNRGYAVIKINDQDPSAWIEANIIPFRFGAISGLESAYAKAAPWVFAWNNNPFAEKPTSITVKASMQLKYLVRDASGKTIRPRPAIETIQLNWQPTAQKELEAKISTLRSFVKDKRARIVFFKKTEAPPHPYDIYVKAPSFSGENSAITESLDLVAEHIQRYVAQRRKQQRTQEVLGNLNRPSVNIIFDLRGNVGGSSFFGRKMLESLHGKPHAEQEILNSSSKEVVWWRATPAHIAWLKDNPYIAHASSEVKKWAAHMAENLQKALDTKEPFFEEHCDQIRTCIYACPNVTAHITIIIDAQCGSSALDFIDEALACGKENVTLAGQPTSADSIYMEACQARVPSTSGAQLTLTYPMKMYKNRTRGHNQPHVPHHMLSESLMHRHPTAAEDVNAFLTEIADALRPPTEPSPERPPAPEPYPLDRRIQG